MVRLQEHYNSTVVKQLTEQFGYKSSMQVPKITKITLNMGIGEAVADKKVVEHAVSDMTKLPDKSQLFVTQENQLRTLKCVKDGLSVVR